MATPTRKSHTEVSFMEQLIIFRAYTKSRCNWSLVLDEVKRQRDKLPQAAMELYASTEGQKLKRRMADQVRKLTKDGMTICNPELKRLVEEVRAMDSRYSQKSDPASKRANLKRLNVSKEVEREVEREVARMSTPLQQDDTQDDGQEDQVEEPQQEPQPSGLANRFTAIPIADDEDEEEAVQPPPKKKGAMEMARDTYQAYQDHLDRLRPIENKMESQKKSVVKRRKFYVGKLKIPNIREEFQISLQNRFSAISDLDIEENDINNTQNVILETCEETLGYMQYKRKNWMSDNTWVKVEERRKAKENVLNATARQQKRQTHDLYREKDKEVKQNCKQDKRNYVEQLAQEAEIACNKGDIKSLYNITKELSGRRSNSNATVKDKNCNVITKDEEQLKRWKDHFEEVLNRPPPTDPPNIEGRQVLNIKTGDITKTEVLNGHYSHALKTWTLQTISASFPIAMKTHKSKQQTFKQLQNNVISTSGGTDVDIQSRKRKAQQVFAILKPVWRSKALRTNTKIRIFNSNVKYILLYGSETWRLTAASTKTLQVFMNRCLRNIIGIKWTNTISNKKLWKRTRQEPIERTITTRRWKWIGHTLRKSNTHVTRQALDWNPQGHRKRGRPKSTWRRDLTSDLQKIGKTWGEAKKLAKDSNRWKATVVALCPPWDDVD
ncbi:Hypothetical predicted protein [Mytilus galloprovincialis]|uniref:DUF6451 domain-containing protein n=1 Tax=Mytilus galloprovincialis TaxID=29158 RepID=A0A8B6H3E5_MYTGA|nr:Hypothetical predicted protein [Mytilus galloprovincialis]